MLIFKIMCLATILIICIGIGFNISAKYTSRVNGLKKMLRALNIFEEKIKFNWEIISQIQKMRIKYCLKIMIMLEKFFQELP